MSLRATTDPLDLLDNASPLSDDERDIRSTVREFLDDRARPHAGRWFSEGRFPAELIPELGKLLPQLHVATGTPEPRQRPPSSGGQRCDRLALLRP